MQIYHEVKKRLNSGIMTDDGEKDEWNAESE